MFYGSLEKSVNPAAAEAELITAKVSQIDCLTQQLKWRDVNTNQPLEIACNKNNSNLYRLPDVHISRIKHIDCNRINFINDLYFLNCLSGPILN